MAQNVKIQLNRAAVRALLRSAEVQADLRRRAERIAAAAGPGHEVVSYVGKNRARETVHTTTPEAAIAEQVHKNLTNAIKAGR